MTKQVPLYTWVLRGMRVSQTCSIIITSWFFGSFFSSLEGSNVCAVFLSFFLPTQTPTIAIAFIVLYAFYSFYCIRYWLAVYYFAGTLVY